MFLVCQASGAPRVATGLIQLQRQHHLIAKAGRPALHMYANFRGQQVKTTMQTCAQRSMGMSADSAPKAAMDAYEGQAGGAQRAFSQFQIYKGRGALCVRPIRPTWRQLPEGGIAIDRPGTLFMEFAAARGERNYDWGSKMVFAMNATEIGTMMEGAGDKIEFFHDPSKGGSEQGMVSKVMRIEPTPDQNGYFFNISVSDKVKNFKGSLSVPVSKGEFGVLRSICQYSLPYLLGFDQVFSSPPQYQPQTRQWGYDMEQGAGAGAYAAAGSAPGYDGASAPEYAGEGDSSPGDYWDQFKEKAAAHDTAPLSAEEEYGEYRPSPDSATPFGTPPQF